MLDNILECKVIAMRIEKSFGNVLELEPINVDS